MAWTLRHINGAGGRTELFADAYALYQIRTASVAQMPYGYAADNCHRVCHRIHREHTHGQSCMGLLRRKAQSLWANMPALFTHMGGAVNTGVMAQPRSAQHSGKIDRRITHHIEKTDKRAMHAPTGNNTYTSPRSARPLKASSAIAAALRILCPSIQRITSISS